jgi:DNA polymerase-3 subunit epsilon
MNLIITDLETTGLDPDFHEIIEIGAIICDSESLEIMTEIDVKVVPEHIEWATPISLSINGYSPDLWDDAILLSDAIQLYEQLGSGAIFTGHNVCFDFRFYVSALKKLNRTSKLDYHRLDIGSMAFPLIQPPVFNLDKIALIVGSQPEQAPHRAINGARKEYEVLCKLKHMGQKVSPLAA